MFQEPLLHATPQPQAAPSRMVLSTSYHVFPLFARGCLIVLPRPMEGDDAKRPDVLDLVEVEGPAPRNWIAALEDTGRNAMPVLLELKAGRAVHRAQTTYGPISALTIDDVQAILFRSTEELRRFRSWPFEDVDVGMAKVEWASAPELFDADEIELPVERHEPVERYALDALEDRIRRVDMYMGGLAHLVTSIQEDSSAIDVVTRLLNVELDSHAAEGIPPRLEAAFTAGAALLGDVDSLVRRVDGPNTDTLILTATCQVLVHYATKQGWPSKEILDAIHDRARAVVEAHGLDGEREQLETWYQFSRSAIDDPSKYPLGDSGSLVRRAVLLLLLRGTLENIVADANKADPHSIGPRVRRIAMDLAALRTGLSALPSKEKGPKASDPGDMLSWLGRTYVSLVLDDDSLAEDRRRVVATYVDSADLRGRWRFSVDSRVLFEVPADVPRGLRKVAEDCRYYGYSVKAHDPQTLIVKDGPFEPLACPVEVTLIQGQTRTDDDEVRFMAKIASLGPRSGDGTQDAREAAAVKKVTKNYLWSLLTANVADVHHCRIGIEPSTTDLVVLVDQLLSTMDRDECIAHLKNVSNVATKFGS